MKGLSNKLKPKILEKIENIEKKKQEAEKIIEIKTAEIKRLNNDLNTIISQEIQKQARSSDLSLPDFIAFIDELANSKTERKGEV